MLSARIVPVVVLIGLAAVVVLSPLSARGTTGEEATFCLGFILLFGFFLAKILKGINLPEISGYIIAGLLCGPFVMNIMSREVVGSLQIFDDLALAIIAMIAGGEMKMSFLKEKKTSIFSVVMGQVVFCFIAALLVVFLAKPNIAFLSGMGPGAVVAVGLLLGVVTSARSPSTTIGVITETRAEGPLTDLIVGMTVILDVFILILIAFIVPVARTLSIPGESFSLLFAKRLFLELFGSIGVGVFFGFLTSSYIRWVGGYLPLFLIAAGFVGSMVCRHYHLEPLLAFMITGFIIENFTVRGDDLIKGLEKSALPVYVVFFALSGASIDLGALVAMWPLALVLVFVRAGAFYAGTMAASGIVPAVKPYARSMWLGFLSQAGVTIGIATIIERSFAWGSELKTLILAVVAVNQLIGPVTLKFLLDKKGETGHFEESKISLRHKLQQKRQS
jgi:Kef-type K+ transport system membrane component KefB